MFRQIRTLKSSEQKVSFVANDTKQIKLKLERYLQAITLLVSGTYDTAAAGSVAQDGILNLIKRVTLNVNGDPRWSWAPKRYWYTTMLDGRVKPSLVDVSATQANGKAASFAMPISFTLAPNSMFDLRAMVPLKYADTAELSLDFGAAADFGANHSNLAFTVQPTYEEVVLTAEEESKLFGAVGPDVMYARKSRLVERVLSELTIDLTGGAAYADFSLFQGLPVGNDALRTFIYATLNGARDDTLIKDYKVLREDPTHEYANEEWVSSQARDKYDYGVQTPISGDHFLKGFTVADYKETGGVPLAGAKPNQFGFRATTAAPNGTTNIVLLNELIRRQPFVRSVA